MTLAFFISLLALSASVALSAFALLRPGGVLRVAVGRYERRLEEDMRLTYEGSNPRGWMVLQVSSIALWLVVALWRVSLPMFLILPVLALLPTIWLSHRRSVFTKLIESQLGAWSTLMASNLSAAPSIFEAMRASVPRTPEPMRSEIKRMVRDLALGASLVHVLRESSLRIKSPIHTGVMTVLTLGARSGGHLPSVLRELADTLRENDRLLGVVRVRTAETKTQTYVLAVLPFVIASLMQFNDPNYLRFLVETLAGRFILTTAVAFWVGAVLSAQKILKVDL